MSNIAHKLIPQDLEAAIAAEYYHQFSGTTITVCALVLRNGYVVVGESTPTDSSAYNHEKGKQVARSHAFSKMWPLLGYQMREDLYRSAPAPRAETVKPWRGETGWDR